MRTSLLLLCLSLSSFSYARAGLDNALIEKSINDLKGIKKEGVIIPCDKIETATLGAVTLLAQIVELEKTNWRIVEKFAGNYSQALRPFIGKVQRIPLKLVNDFSKLERSAGKNFRDYKTMAPNIELIQRVVLSNLSRCIKK